MCSWKLQPANLEAARVQDTANNTTLPTMHMHLGIL